MIKTVRLLEGKVMKEIVTRLENDEYTITNHDVDYHHSVMHLETDWLGRHKPVHAVNMKTETTTLKMGEYEITIKKG